ncbi:MAG: hypothetical protein QXT85_02110 [Nanopusillaceae archaeon]
MKSNEANKLSFSNISLDSEEINKLIYGRAPIKEIIKIEELIDLFSKHKIISMWGILPSAPLHFNIDKIIIKQFDFIEIGFKHHILITDILLKLEVLDFDNDYETKLRTKYYVYYLKHIIGLKKRTRYITSSSYRLNNKYYETIFKVLNFINTSKLKKSLPRNLRNLLEDFPVSKILHPLMQSIDPFFVSKDDSNIIFADMGQRKVYLLSRKISKYLNNKKPVLMFTTLPHDIKGNPLNKSKIETRLNIHDDPEILYKKIMKIETNPENPEKDPLIELYLYSILPYFKVIELKTINNEIISISEENKKDLISLYSKRYINVDDMKKRAYEYLLERLEKIKNFFDKHPKLIEWINLERFKNQKI